MHVLCFSQLVVPIIFFDQTRLVLAFACSGKEARKLKLGLINR